MKSSTEVLRRALRVVAGVGFFLALGGACAQGSGDGKAAPVAAAMTESQEKAYSILMRMADFLSGSQRFSVSVNGAYDAVQKSGQKIEFSELRKVTLSRPDRLRVENEGSDGAKTLTVFNGKEIVLTDSARNVYAVAPQPGGLDQSIVHFVQDLGMRLPLAMILVSQLPAELKSRARSVDYVEKTSIHGIPSHHLAVRTDSVDFQVWVADGDKPLPQRVVITYKTSKGEPQFHAQFSDWNLVPAISDTTFQATVPDGAQKVAFATQLPRLSPAARKSSADKGTK